MNIQQLCRLGSSPAPGALPQQAAEYDYRLSVDHTTAVKTTNTRAGLTAAVRWRFDHGRSLCQAGGRLFLPVSIATGGRGGAANVNRRRRRQQTGSQIAGTVLASPHQLPCPHSAEEARSRPLRASEHRRTQSSPMRGCGAEGLDSGAEDARGMLASPHGQHSCSAILRNTERKQMREATEAAGDTSKARSLGQVWVLRHLSLFRVF